MPPPPLPPSIVSPPSPPPSHQLTSPTASFANLSLLSPLVNGPTPHFPGSFARVLPKEPLSPTITHGGLTEPASLPSLSVKEQSILGMPLVRREAATDTPPTPPPASPGAPLDVDVSMEESSGEAAADTAVKEADPPAISPVVSAAESNEASVDQPPTDTAQPETLSDAPAESKLSAADIASETVDAKPPTAVPSPAPPTKVKLSLKDFYLRRAFRILPAYLVALNVWALLTPDQLSAYVPNLFLLNNFVGYQKQFKP